MFQQRLYEIAHSMAAEVWEIKPIFRRRWGFGLEFDRANVRSGVGQISRQSSFS